jgi:Fe-S cluster assembly iron-binding protein IscA
MINLTPIASTKVKEIMTMQNPSPVALRVAGFKFNNPNVKSTCGCGSSFSV